MIVKKVDVQTFMKNFVFGGHVTITGHMDPETKRIHIGDGVFEDWPNVFEILGERGEILATLDLQEPAPVTNTNTGTYEDGEGLIYREAIYYIGTLE